MWSPRMPLRPRPSCSKEYFLPHSLEPCACSSYSASVAPGAALRAGGAAGAAGPTETAWQPAARAPGRLLQEVTASPRPRGGAGTGGGREGGGRCLNVQEGEGKVGAPGRRAARGHGQSTGGLGQARRRAWRAGVAFEGPGGPDTTAGPQPPSPVSSFRQRP